MTLKTAKTSQKRLYLGNLLTLFTTLQKRRSYCVKHITFALFCQPLFIKKTKIIRFF